MRTEDQATASISEDGSGSGWRSRLTRRWPWMAGAALAAAAAAWMLRGSDRRPAEGAATPAAQPPGATAGGSDRTGLEVSLDTSGVRLAGIETARVDRLRGGALVANGTITYDGNHVSVVASRTEGRIVSVRTDLGQRVAKGQVLAIVESPDVGETRGTWQRANAGVEIAQRNYEREKRLYEQSISSEKELLEAEAAYRSAQAELNASAAKLSALGAAPAGSGSGFGLASPISGIVVERHATPGQIVGPATDLLTVADLRHVWITVDVYEQDFGRVRNGAAATVMPSSISDTFAGQVTFAGGIVDSISRTVKVRVEVENESRRLRPGMFAQVRIETSQPSPHVSSVVVPEVAVQDLNGSPVVFQPGSKPGHYLARPVVLGPRVGRGSLTIVSGLGPGDEIVTEGAFRLKAELLKASFAEDE